MPTTYKGSCHCGAITVEHSSAVPPQAAEVRECQCSFCRLHGARAVSDPQGELCFTEHTAGALHRYRFSLNTADFLICRNCGAYLGCVLSNGDELYGIVNINTLDDKALFTSPPIAAVYDSEDTASRIARRKARWTPASVLTLQSNT